MKRQTRDKIKITLIGLLITILVYFFIGTLINYTGMKIYSPNDLYEVDFQGKLNVNPTIQNNAPLTLPFTNPLFYYGINISEKNITCTFSSRNCKDNIIIDIGRLEAGEKKDLNVELYPNGTNNFTFETIGYLNTFNKGILRKSISTFCVQSNNSGNQNIKYLCNELREA